jgi:hypothetical protein
MKIKMRDSGIAVVTGFGTADNQNKPLREPKIKAQPDGPTDLQKQMAACLMIQAIANNADLPESIGRHAMSRYHKLMGKGESVPNDVYHAMETAWEFCRANNLHYPDPGALLIMRHMAEQEALDSMLEKAEDVQHHPDGSVTFKAQISGGAYGMWGSSSQ